jgi:hypothetical protein
VVAKEGNLVDEYNASRSRATGELGYAFKLPICRSVGKAEFSWARIVSNEVESDTYK